jgi:AcrR family transcriptional regulator
MSATGDAASPPPRLGLRERKKLKTRNAIQEEALRLFAERGYAGTTVEQIAAAAEISPSTFFRYFTSKEGVVLHDAYDPLLIEAFREQPAEVSPLEALRAAMRAVFSGLSEGQLKRERQRQRLIMLTPELRAQAFEQFFAALEMVGELVAERAGRGADDLAVRAFAGAVIGIAMAVVQPVIEDPEADYMSLFDEAIGQLRRGLELEGGGAR